MAISSAVYGNSENLSGQKKTQEQKMNVRDSRNGEMFVCTM
jgi:hypothetical protein